MSEIKNDRLGIYGAEYSKCKPSDDTGLQRVSVVYMLWSYTIVCTVQEASHKNKDAGVEAVGPARIRRRWQLLPFEQVVDVAQHQRVGVEEHTLLELRQSPTVQLCECDS